MFVIWSYGTLSIQRRLFLCVNYNMACLISRALVEDLLCLSQLSTKPDDAMYVWLENVNSGSFEVCIREFLPFDGKHQDTIVVRESVLNVLLRL